MNLRPPPAHTHKQKSPVVEELRRLALKGVADELENPSNNKQAKPINPQFMNEYAGDKYSNPQQDGRYPQRMARPIHRMLMARRVLRNPLFVAAIAKHQKDDTRPWTGGVSICAHRRMGLNPISKWELGAIRKWWKCGDD
jgi:hypothetical protein